LGGERVIYLRGLLSCSIRALQMRAIDILKGARDIRGKRNSEICLQKSRENSNQLQK